MEIDIIQIKTGDCLIVKGKSWLSKAIRFFTKSDYTHSGILYWCYDELMVIEETTYTRGIGLVMTTFASYLDSNKGLLIRHPKFEIDGSEYGKYMLPFLGKLKYSLWDLIVAQPIFQITKKINKIGIWIGGRSIKDNRTVCSGWNYFVYNHFTNKFKDWFEKTPSDLVIDENFDDKFIRN